LDEHAAKLTGFICGSKGCICLLIACWLIYFCKTSVLFDNIFFNSQEFTSIILASWSIVWLYFVLLLLFIRVHLRFFCTKGCFAFFKCLWFRQDIEFLVQCLTIQRVLHG